jgi:DHA3 family tetracycline resistance protein-like MFS transporter
VVLGFPWLWVTISIAALLNVTVSGPLSVALPFLVKDKLHQDASTLGLISSAFSVGSVLTALWLGRYHRLRRRGLVAYLAWLMGGLMIAAYGLLPLPGILVAALMMGSAIMVFGLVWTNSLQELVPGEMLGRVSSIDNLGSFVLLPVGYALAGLLTDKIGPSWVFIGGGLATAWLAGMGLLHPGIRNLD